MKFCVIEFTFFKVDPETKETIILYRLFDSETSMNDAEKFCQEVKAKGGAVNIRTRTIDLSVFK